MENKNKVKLYVQNINIHSNFLSNETTEIPDPDTNYCTMELAPNSRDSCLIYKKIGKLGKYLFSFEIPLNIVNENKAYQQYLTIYPGWQHHTSYTDEENNRMMFNKSSIWMTVIFAALFSSVAFVKGLMNIWDRKKKYEN